MAQSVRVRRLGSVEYLANNFKQFDLGRGTLFRELWIKLSGQLTLLAGSNTAALLERGDEWSVIKNIRLIANGTTDMMTMDGNALWWWNYFLFGKAPQLSPLLAAGGANPSFEGFLKIPFWIPRSRRPLDTAIDTTKLSDWKLEINWGDHTSINGSATAFAVEPSVEVRVVESFGANQQAVFSEWRRPKIIQPINQTSTQEKIPIPVGPVYRSFLVNAQATPAAIDVDTPTVLNRLQFKSGAVTFWDLDRLSLQRAQELALSGPVERTWDSVAGAYMALRRSASANREAWFYYDHVGDGLLSEAIDSDGLSETFLEGDVVASTGSQLVIYPQQIIPVRQAA